MRQKRIALFLVFIMIISIFHINSFEAMAVSTYMRWNKVDTIDSLLQKIQNKAGQDDVLLELQMETVGTYSLEYFLEDNRKTTVSFKQQYDRLVIGYKVEEMDGLGVITNITEDLIDRSFLEMDYTLAIPDWEYVPDKPVNGDGFIEYTVLKSAATQYPGIAFNIDGKKVYIRWDFQSNIVSYLLTGYAQGNIMPTTFTRPNGHEDFLKILKGLDGFNVTPTHLTESGGVNVELSPISIPGDEKPGARPGMRLSFKQPKEIADIDTDWAYNEGDDLEDLKCLVELEEISEGTYTDIRFNLNKTDGSESTIISEIPDAAANPGDIHYTYSEIGGEHYYSIDFVKDKTDLANQDHIIQWNALEASKIYNVSISIEKALLYPDYEFVKYLPESKFGYTYMEYDLRRSNMTEAYLDIVPYEIGTADEVEYTILYSKEQKVALDPENDLWVKHYHSNEQEGNIYVPVPFRRDSSQDFYQIIVDFAGVDISSQLLKYRAKDDMNIPPTTPRIESVERLFVIPTDDAADTNPLKIQMDLVWTAPDNRDTGELDTIFENDNPTDRIYYELMVNEVPTDTEENPFQVIKLFEVFKDGDEYKLGVYNDLPGFDQSSVDPSMLPSSTVNYSEGYNSIDELFRMEGISLYNENGWAEIIDTDADEDANTYTVGFSGDEYSFEYPGVNYLRIRAVTRIDDHIGISYPSIPYSISLSPIAYNIPIPDSLSYAPVLGDVENRSGIDLDFKAVDISTYEEAMIQPVNRALEDDKVYYGIYISEDYNKIYNLEVADEDSPEADTPEEDSPDYLLIDDNPRALDVFDVSLSDNELASLREDNVMYYNIESEKEITSVLTSGIAGLDRNKTYYIRVVTKLNITGVGYDRIKMSNPSEILSITTPDTAQPPDEDEVKPLAVENLEAEFFDDAMLSGRISWRYQDSITLEKDKYAFEIISIEDKSLPDEFLQSSVMLEDIIEDDSLENDNMEFWRVYADEVAGQNVTYLVKYNRETDTWDIQDNEMLILGDNTVAIVDDSNTPNRVYYYYVRTIKLTGDIVQAASPYRMDTLTTIPVKGPINLMVSYDSGYTFNAKNESIVSFDAPIPEDAVIGEDYIMEIHVKGEADDDYSIIKYPATFLKVGEGAPTGYRRLYYRISNLSAGKAYSVKVRIEDRTIDMEELPDGTTAYPKSGYCERIIIRTEFDQGEYNKEVKFKEYLAYYDLKTKDLKAGAYITLENTPSKNVVKYRESYGLGELQLSRNGLYKLATDSVKTNIIYLPGKIVEQINTNNITIVIEPNDHSISLRPYSIGKNITGEINTIINEINSINATLSDYYIRITVENSSYSGTILSKTPASSMLNIKLDIVGSEELEGDIEIEMMNELTTVIAARRVVLIEELTRQLEIGLDEARMLEITKAAIESAKDNYGFGANYIFETALESGARNVAELAKNMMMGLKPKDAAFGLNVYKKSGSTWIKLMGNYIASRYSVDTKDMGSYILLPYSSEQGAITGKYNDEQLETINKFSLYEVFNSTELSNPSQSLTKYRMLSALARVLGMQQGGNEAQYLKDKGIIFTTTGQYLDVTREEGLFLYTQAAAIRNGISIDSYKIMDYNIIQDISSVKAAYKNTLLIGANMNMFSLNNGRLYPTSKMTIQEFIDLLVTVDKGFN